MKTQRRNISITNKRVSDEFDKVGKGNVSKFIEECILYYLDNLENGYVTKDQIKGVIFDCLKDMPVFSGEITNLNYVNESKQIEEDVLEMLKL